MAVIHYHPVGCTTACGRFVPTLTSPCTAMLCDVTCKVCMRTDAYKQAVQREDKRRYDDTGVIRFPIHHDSR